LLDSTAQLLCHSARPPTTAPCNEHRTTPPPLPASLGFCPGGALIILAAAIAAPICSAVSSAQVATSLSALCFRALLR